MNFYIFNVVGINYLNLSHNNSVHNTNLLSGFRSFCFSIKRKKKKVLKMLTYVAYLLTLYYNAFKINKN